MADCMYFPNDWAKFLEDYSFRDHKEFYTNGAMLVPTFRVEQMMHHYLRKAADETVEVEDKELLKAIKILIKQYEHSKNSDYVHSPVAHAFYHTWKQLDAKKERQ